MSLRLAASTGLLSVASAPSGSTFSVGGWSYMSGSGNEFPYFFSIANSAETDYISITSESGSSGFQPFIAGDGGAASSYGSLLSFGAWYYFGLAVTGGTATLYYRADGGAWQTALTMSSASVTTPAKVKLGTGPTSRTIDYEGWKMWDGVALGQADFDVESRSYTPAIAKDKAWAVWKLKTNGKDFLSTRTFTPTGVSLGATKPDDLLAEPSTAVAGVRGSQAALDLSGQSHVEIDASVLHNRTAFTTFMLYRGQATYNPWCNLWVSHLSGGYQMLFERNSSGSEVGLFDFRYATTYGYWNPTVNNLSTTPNTWNWIILAYDATLGTTADRADGYHGVWGGTLTDSAFAEISTPVGALGTSDTNPWCISDGGPYSGFDAAVKFFGVIGTKLTLAQAQAVIDDPQGASWLTAVHLGRRGRNTAVDFTGTTTPTVVGNAPVVNGGPEIWVPSSASTMSRVLYDTFTDTDGVLLTDHIPEQGLGWKKFVEATSWNVPHIIGNRLTAPFQTGTYYYATTPVRAADVRVEFDSIVHTNSGQWEIWMRWDGQFSSTGSYLRLYGGGTAGTLNHEIRNGGTYINDGTVATVAPTVDVPQHIAVEMRGTTVSLWVDGTLRWTYTNSGMPTAPGWVGVRISGSGGGSISTTGVQIANLQIFTTQPSLREAMGTLTTPTAPSSARAGVRMRIA